MGARCTRYSHQIYVSLASVAVITHPDSSTSICTCDMKVCDGTSIEIGSLNHSVDWPVESGTRLEIDVTSACSGTLFDKKSATECLLNDDGLAWNGDFRRLVASRIPWSGVGPKMASQFVPLQPIPQSHRVRANIEPEPQNGDYDVSIR